MNQAVALERVTKRFGDIVALDGVDLQVARGDTVALLGPNGAGKTTALCLMLGLRKPTGGSVSLFGLAPTAAQARQRIGVMLQDSGLPATLKVREVVQFFQRLYPKPISVKDAIAAAQLEPLGERQVSALSGGQRQRLFFALAIVGDPELLILDEPTVGLDLESRLAFWERLSAMARCGKTIVLTTHYLEEADVLAKRIVVLDRGRIMADGTPDQIKSRIAGKVVSFSAPDATEARLLRLPGVSRVCRRGHRWVLLSASPEASLAALFGHGIQISELEVASADLEEAFLFITREQAIRHEGASAAAGLRNAAVA